MAYIQIGIDQYTKFDPGISRMRTANHEHVPGWLGAMIYCLKNGDNEVAELIQGRNERRSDLELRAVMHSQREIVKMIERRNAA